MRIPRRRLRRAPLPGAIYILFFVRLINAMGNFVFPFMTMLLTVKLGYSKTAAGTFMTVMSFLGGLGILAGGKISDSFGRKRTIITVQLTASILFGICAFMGLDPIVPFIIALANIMTQSSLPAFNAMIADIAPPERRKEAFALLYWGNNIGFSIGPIMAGYLFNTHTAYMFYGNMIALAVVSFLLGFFVKESLPGREQPANHKTASLAATEEAAETGGFFQVLKKRPILISFSLVMLLYNFVYAQHQFSLPLFLNEILGNAGPKTYGMVMTTNGLTVVACTIFLTLILRRFSASSNMVLAAIFYAAGFGMLTFCNSTFAIIVSTIIWTIGEVISATNCQVFVAAHAPMSHRGRFNSMFSFVSGLGTALSPIVSGAYIQRMGVRAIWPASFSLGLMAGFFMGIISIAERRRVRIAA
ncbi:MAG TPA: MFS transporter [Spirochaetia bacterium]|nr:MFS transporter [Spirochaetia bacterium]